MILCPTFHSWLKLFLRSFSTFLLRLGLSISRWHWNEMCQIEIGWNVTSKWVSKYKWKATPKRRAQNVGKISIPNLAFFALPFFTIEPNEKFISIALHCHTKSNEKYEWTQFFHTHSLIALNFLEHSPNSHIIAKVFYIVCIFSYIYACQPHKLTHSQS